MGRWKRQAAVGKCILLIQMICSHFCTRKCKRLKTVKMTLCHAEQENVMIGALMVKKNLAKSFQYLNDKDLSGFMSAWADEGVFMYPLDFPEKGVFEGKTAVEGWFKLFLDSYKTIAFDVHTICVENIFDMTGNNIGIAQWDKEMVTHEGEIERYSGTTVVTIRGGKVVMAKDYFFDPE